MNGLPTQAGVAQYFSPDKSRGSIYFKDGVASDNSFYIQGQTATLPTPGVAISSLASKTMLMSTLT